MDEASIPAKPARTSKELFHEGTSLQVDRIKEALQPFVDSLSKIGEVFQSPELNKTVESLGFQLGLLVDHEPSPKMRRRAKYKKRYKRVGEIRTRRR